MKKIFNNRGETLIEVLVSLLIVALCILMFQGSIVTAAKINKKSNKHIEPFRITESEDTGKNVMINGNDSGVKIYKTKEGYYYYE